MAKSSYFFFMVNALNISNRRKFLLLLLMLFAGSRSRSEMVDDDLQCVQSFLKQTSRNTSNWEFIGSSKSPCTLLHSPDMESSVFEIECSRIARYGGQLRVTALLLEGMHLGGPFPMQTIGNLSSLVRLSFSNNSLSGQLPAELWQLSELRYLSLAYNHFSGKIPAGISHLSKLDRLDLAHNLLSGPLPSELSELYNLQYLYLSSNMFTKADVLTMPSLRDVNVSHNHLDGSLMSSKPWDLAQLLTLDMSYNNLSGSLSVCQYLISLTYLDLSHNAFTDDVSTLALPSSLQWLDLSSNKLTGDPSHNMPLLSHITHLGLAANELAPNAFDWVLGYKNLKYLNMSQSCIVGNIPYDIGDLTNLTHLDICHNELKGGIPSSISTLHSLTYLDLSYNNLSGDTSMLANLSSLSYFNLSFNNPTACAPPSLRNKFGLSSFRGQLCEPIAADIPHFFEKHIKKSTANVGIIVGVLAAGTLLCFVVAGGFLLCKKQSLTGLFVCERNASTVFMPRKSRPGVEIHASGPFSFETDSGVWHANVKNPSLVPVVIFQKPLLNLTFADLLQATSNFSKESQLTEGGFGPVYRANLPGHLDVTIKVLTEGRILNDEEASKEFEFLSNIKHPNVLQMIGFCLVGDERLVMYQHMENGGLHTWLHELPIGTQLNDWSRDVQCESTDAEAPTCSELAFWDRRHKIALGIARALAFLHHGHFPQIVHREVKASNVMLDKGFEPQLADTGLVALLAASDEGLLTGSTSGYIPPEYRQAGNKVNVKGDVYSYGVVLLELMTGKRPMGDFYQEGYTGDLVGWVRILMKERTHRALDPRILCEEVPTSEMLQALHVGYLCTAELPCKRPTMHQVVGLLKDIDPHDTSS